MQTINNTTLPPKSNLWIGASIAGGIIFLVIITKFIGGLIFGNFVRGNIALEIIIAMIFLAFGIYLGSSFGVGYVGRRTNWDIPRVNKISIVTATIIVVFQIFFMIMDIFIAQAGGEKFNFPFEELVMLLAAVVLTIFLVRNFLRQKATNIPISN